MSQSCDFCGRVLSSGAIEDEEWCAAHHEEWCAKRLARAGATLAEALPIARDAAERFPREYTAAPPFYPHAWVLEAVSVALVQRNRERIRAEEAEARSKAHSATIAELTYAVDGMFHELQVFARERTEIDRAWKALGSDPNIAAARESGVGIGAAIEDVIGGLRNELASTARISQAKRVVEAIAERDEFAARCEIAERDNERLTADVAQLREVAKADDEEGTSFVVSGFAVSQVERIERAITNAGLRAGSDASAIDIAINAIDAISYIRCSANFVELLPHDVATRAVSDLTAAKRSSVVHNADAYYEVAKMLGLGRLADPTSVLEKIAKLQSDRESVMVDLRKQLEHQVVKTGDLRQYLIAIGDLVPDRQAGYPAIVTAVRVLVEERDRLAREVKEMGEEMARDVKPEDVAAAAAELGTCPRCNVEHDSHLDHCEDCGVCNSCVNEDDDGCDCDDDDDDEPDDADEPEWQSIAHRLFAAACPELAPSAKLGEEADRWISEVTSARRVREIAHADNRRLVAQAKELAARLDEIRRGRGDVVNNYSAIDGTAMVDGTPHLRAAIIERVAQLIAAKVGA